MLTTVLSVIFFCSSFFVIWFGYYFWRKRKDWALLQGFLIALAVYIIIPLSFPSINEYIIQPSVELTKCVIKPGQRPSPLFGNNDNDGLSNLQECNQELDWNKYDTDGDGVGDGYIEYNQDYSLPF